MNELKINSNIRAREVRIVNTDSPGIYSLKDALKIADNLNLDLVEINCNVSPSICKVIDYQKYQYEQKKKAKENKAKQTKIETKEIRLGYNIGDNDLSTKEKQAIKFLEAGNKILISMFFKGRTIVYADQGKLKMEQFISNLSEYSEIDKVPSLEGRKITAIIRAKKK